jgi:uncharacterized protein (DUF488 family)
MAQARRRTRPTLYTIGHSNRSYAELLAALRAWHVETLVDIRHATRSRANPQFDAAALRRRLPSDGIAYVEMPELGGRRGRAADVDPMRNAGWQVAAFKNYADYAESSVFAEALARLLARARHETCAVMCAEAVWWRCHRRIVADYALLRGAQVKHIFTPTKATRATRTPFARVDRQRQTLRYPKARPRTGQPQGRPKSRQSDDSRT